MRKNSKSVIASVAFAIAAVALSACDGGGESGAAAPASNGASSITQATGGNNSNSGGSGSLVTPSCVNSDANHICLAVHFVSYKDSSGTPVANQSQVNTIFGTMNQLWSQCNIGFQVEQYDQVDPTSAGLSYGANSQNELDQIRNTYGSPSNMMLAVNTGPWGTAVNAWTNMPGSAPYGAIMEASIVDYGGGIIYAHEFGHYLGLDHVSDSSNLMNAIIATNSTALTSDQCNTARSVAPQYWSAMMRH
jgi:hypothetical protein